VNRPLKHLHFLGICGTAMGSVAAALRDRGCIVTGSDEKIYPPMSDFLHRKGINLTEPYAAENLPNDPETVVVIGNAIKRGNPEVEAVLSRKMYYLSLPEILKEFFLRGRHNLVVTGTHGKTSTTSLLTWILTVAEMEPAYMIGGIPRNLGQGALFNDSRHFVIEGDEYDTAFFDKRSKFVHYRCRTAILNNLEFDHADIFDDLAAIERQFHHLVRIVPHSGLIIAGPDESLDRVLVQGAWTPVERTGRTSGWQAGQPAADGSFEIAWQGRALGRVRWQLLGEHNRLNALAAVAAARHAGVDPERAIAALGAFSGVRRRMEVRGCTAGVTVYDDFAHHPTAIRTTLEGLRHKVGAARILAVLEPRSNTMKRGVMKDALPGSLAQADRVYVYTAGLGWDAGAVLAPLGARVQCFAEIDALVAAISRDSLAGDHVLVMSNGGFGGIHKRLLDRLAKGEASTPSAARGK
jgi:UDP-N-acetylmuramate: L-alanyl-gamma-D-glutamyl-meso-diaminopimelate ligase